MDFGALPPEINSARMYFGAGAAPLLGAAAAWNDIAVELSTAASAIESVITRLSSDQWLGTASLSMAAAAQPLLAWLSYTAESSALAAAQAAASVAAFETAFAMTVPPAEVAANRARLAALMATNIFGQNVPAIAATEARYGEMWAQDASAMYGYAASCAGAVRLNPLTRPSETTNPGGIASQAAAVSHAAASVSVQQAGFENLISTVSDAVMSLSAPVTSSPHVTSLGAFIEDIIFLDIPRFVESAFHGLGATADYATMIAANLLTLQTSANTATSAGGVAPAAAAGSALAQTVTSAGVGDASSVGALSVPVGWTTAAPAATGGAASDGTGWAVPDEDVPSPAGMVAGTNGAGARPGPRYGVKPRVMPKKVLV
ncbi:PPE family protein [Mycobacterium marinum]|uniref:PPE family protein n=1 Tax=Mycobacterium marinum TaxID=1781 RepID=UPI003566AE38